MDAEIYKFTTVNSLGKEIVEYVLPAGANQYRRMMTEEYGDTKQEGMRIDDLPENIKKQVKEALLHED